jgi:hypothetical protein
LVVSRLSASNTRRSTLQLGGGGGAGG